MTYKDLFKNKVSDVKQPPADKPATINGLDADAPVHNSAPATKPATKH